MIWRLGFIATLVIAGLGVVMFYQSASSTSRSQGDVPVYSDVRFDPYGTAAIRDLCAERGIPVRMLERPGLEPTDHGVLFQVLSIPKSAFSPPYHLPTQQLVEWISQGNTVIQFSRKPTELMDKLKIAPSTRPAYDTMSAQDYETRGDWPQETTADVCLARLASPAGTTLPSTHEAQVPLLLWSPMQLAESVNPAWTPMARLMTKGKSIVAGQFRIGKGKLIVVGAPTPALNGMIGLQGNLDFILAQIGNGPVILDEWSHGIGHEATIIGFIHDVGLLPLLLQLGFIAVLFMWSTSGFRRRDDLAPARQRSSIEQIQTLGYLYNRSFDDRTTFNHINTEVRRRLAEALRCQPREIQARVKTLKPELRRKFEDLSARLKQLSPSHGPRCLSCGYDLYLMKSDQCPECGTPIAPPLGQQIAKASTGIPPSGKHHRFRLDSLFADVLTLSHQLTREVQRDRSAL